VTPVGAGLVALVLLAAVLHAVWNALTKSSEDRDLTFAVMLGTCAIAGVVASLIVAPPARAALPYLAASACFHFLYQVFLLRAYRSADLSQAYPIARGTAPLVVALLAAVFAGEVPRPLQLVGVAVASLAMTSFALEAGAPREGLSRSIGAAFVTAVMIGAYTFLDAEGVRHAGNPLGYVAWNAWATALPFCIVSAVRHRARLPAFLRAHAARGVVGGVLGTTAYGIVLFALSQGAMANVAALRETSVVFAAWIGTRMLGERGAVRRIVAALAVAVGVVLLQAG